MHLHMCLCVHIYIVHVLSNRSHPLGVPFSHPGVRVGIWPSKGPYCLLARCVVETCASGPTIFCGEGEDHVVVRGGGILW